MKIKDLADTYLLKKELLEACLDGDNPIAPRLREALTVKQLVQLRRDLVEMEDMGIHLIAERKRWKN